MLIEYRLKFGKDGLTITQRIDSGGSGVNAKPGAPTEANSLAASYTRSKAQNALQSGKGSGPSPKDVGGDPEYGGGPSPKDPGGEPFGGGAGPNTIIGPIIFTCRPDVRFSNESEAGVSGEEGGVE